jgi:hypothetical protein
MKNFKKLFTVMLVLSIIFTACNKDTSLTEQNQIDPTEQKILDFKEKMNIGDKSGETMTVEEAVWNIEAALNYTYNDFEGAELITIESVSIPVNVSESGEIEFSDVVEAYNILENSMIGIVGENSMSMTDIEFIVNEEKSGETELEMTTIVKGGIPNLYTFGSTDYWHAIWEVGKCGAYSGQQVGKDAATQIEYKANLVRSAPVNGYITDVAWSPWYSGFESPYNQYLFYAGGSGDNLINTCLEPAEMNYWLNQLKSLANDYKPTGKEITGYEAFGDGYNSVGGGWGTAHFARISYGIFHYGSPEE